MAGGRRLPEWPLKRFQHRDGLIFVLGPSLKGAVGPCRDRRYVICLPLGENVLKCDIEADGSAGKVPATSFCMTEGILEWSSLLRSDK